MLLPPFTHDALCFVPLPVFDQQLCFHTSKFACLTAKICLKRTKQLCGGYDSAHVSLSPTHCTFKESAFKSVGADASIDQHRRPSGTPDRSILQGTAELLKNK